MKNRIAVVLCIMALLAVPAVGSAVCVCAEENAGGTARVMYDEPVTLEVKADMLMVRSGPGAGNTATGMIKKGTLVQVYGEETTGDGKWCVIHNEQGTESFVSGAYLIEPGTAPDGSTAAAAAGPQPADADKETTDTADTAAKSTDAAAEPEGDAADSSGTATETADAAGDGSENKEDDAKETSQAAVSGEDQDTTEASGEVSAEKDPAREQIPSSEDPEHGFIFIRNSDGTVSVEKY